MKDVALIGPIYRLNQHLDPPRDHVEIVGHGGEGLGRILGGEVEPAAVKVRRGVGGPPGLNPDIAAVLIGSAGTPPATLVVNERAKIRTSGLLGGPKTHLNKITPSKCEGGKERWLVEVQVGLTVSSL